MLITYLQLTQLVLGILKLELQISLSSVVEKMSIQISTSITLNYVLQMPNLSCNLISISQLTKSSHYSAQFFRSYCVFQNLSSEITIDSVKEYEGLYYFDETKVSECCQTTTCDYVSSPRVSEILLWYYIMGRLNFQYLKQLFLFIF